MSTLNFPAGTQPLYPEGESGWIMIIVTILCGAVIIPASFTPQTFIVDPSSGAVGTVIASGTFAFTAIGAIIGGAFSVGKKIASYGYILFILALLLQIQIMLNNFDHNILQSSDTGATKYGLPAMRNIGLPVGRFTQLSYDMGICWWDLQVMWRNIIVDEVATIAIDCVEQDWNDVVNKTVGAAGAISAIPIYFIQEDGKQPFEFAQALEAIATAITSVRPMLECSCEELHVVYDIVFDPLNDKNLSLALDRACNIIAYYPFNITTWALTFAFNGDGPSVYNCDNQATINATIACAIVRPPDFYPVQVAWCEMSNYTGFWVENTMNTILNSFIGEFYTGNLLSFHDIIASVLCWVGHFVLDIVDIITHIDLVFDTKVLYLKIATFNTLINVEYQFCDGIEEFWNNFNDEITTDIGTAFGESARLLFMFVDTIIRFYVALINTIIAEAEGDNDDEFVALIQNFNTQPFVVYWNETKNAIVDIANQINNYTGQATSELLNYLQSMFDIFFSVIQSLALNASSRKRFNINGINTFIIDTLPTKTNASIIHFHGIYVSFGNWFRQFDETNSCSYGSIPPVIRTLSNPSGHIICYLGNIVETIGQFGRSFGDQLSVTMFTIYTDVVNNVPVSAAAPYIQQLNSWFNTEMLIVYTNLIESYAGTLGSVFGPIQCPCATGPGCSTGCTGITGCNNTISTTVSAQFFNIVYDWMDAFMGMIFHFYGFILQVVVTILADTGGTFTAAEGAQLVCEFTQFLIDLFGRFFKIFKALGDFLDCLIGDIPSGGNINVVSGTLYWVLFDPNNSSGLRNGICVAIQTMFTILVYIINFMEGLFTQGASYFLSQVEAGAADVVNFLVNSLNSWIQTYIDPSMSSIQSAFNQVLSGLRTVICFINQVVNVFSPLQHITDDTLNLDFQIPSIPLGSIPINLGLIGSWNINLGSINFPSINLGTYSYPDPNSIITALGQMQSDINSLGSGCSGTCGTGPLQPGFCTSTPTIPPIPPIPNVPANWKKRQPSFYNETEQIADTLFQDVFNNYTQNVCSGYYNIATNTSLPLDLQKSYYMQYLECVMSAQLSFSLDMMIYGNFSEEYMDPQTFMSTGRFFLTVVGIAKKLYYPIWTQVMCLGASQIEAGLVYNQSTAMTERCQPWSVVYAQNNLTSPWVYDVGEFMEIAREEIENSTTNSTFGITDLITALWNGMSAARGFAFDVQPGANYSIYDSFFISYNAYQQSLSNTTVKRFYQERVAPLLSETSPLTKRWDDPDNLYNIFHRRWVKYKEYLYQGYLVRKEKFFRFFEPKSKRAENNRQSIGNMRYVVNHMYKEYSHLYGVYRDKESEEKYLNEERNLEMLYTAVPLDTSKISSVEELTVAWMYASKLGREKIKRELGFQMDVASGKRQAINNPFANLTTICGIPTINGGTTCINCTLLFAILDQMVDRSLECFSISLTYFDLLNQEFLTPFVQSIPNPFALMNQQTNGLAAQWSLMVTGENMTEYQIAYDENRFDMENTRVVYDDIGTVGADFSIIINPTQTVVDFIAQTIIEPLIADVVKLNISIKGIVNYIQYSFVNSTIEASNTAFFWLKAFVNSPPSMDCAKLAERGVGIGSLPISFGIVALSAIIICAVVGRISYSTLAAISPIFLFFPYLILVINYGISPTSFPALPFCLMDDVYKILLVADVDCINWNTTLPGLTSPDCANSTTGYVRTWVDCSADPYYFDNGFRVTYFLLQYYWPAALDVLRYNDLYPFQAFRSILGMNSLMFFDYEPGIAPAVYKSCAFLRIHNLFVLALMISALGSIATIVATLVIIVVIFLVSIIFYLGLLAVSLGGAICSVQPVGESETFEYTEDYINSNLQGYTSNTVEAKEVLFEPSSAQKSNNNNDFGSSRTRKAKAHITAFIKTWLPRRVKRHSD